MSHLEASKKPVTRGKKYDYLWMSKGLSKKDSDDESSSTSQSDPVKIQEIVGATGGTPHPQGASYDEDEFDYWEGSERHETSLQDMTSDKHSFPGLSVESALAKEEENNRKLKAEIEALKQEEALLQKRVEADKLRKQLADQRARVASLRGNVENESRSKSRDGEKKLKKTKTQNKQSASLKNDDDIDIVKLRKNKPLRRKVKKQMQKLGLNDSDADESHISDSDVNSTESDADSSQISNSSSNKKSKKSKKGRKSKKGKDSDTNLSFSSSDSSDEKKKKKNKKLSGIKAKASDSVKCPQKYPQAFLRYEFVSSNVTFEKLDLNLFVCGELEIISDKKTKEPEKSGRLKLLKKIMYNSSCYEFVTLKSFYAACLREIEVGNKTWEDDFSTMEMVIMQKHVPKTKSGTQFGKKPFKFDKKSENPADGSDTKEKVWFCSYFQRNKCLHKGNHMKVVKGVHHYCQHICATCWQKDSKKLEHPECSSACPYSKQ